VTVEESERAVITGSVVILGLILNALAKVLSQRCRFLDPVSLMGKASKRSENTQIYFRFYSAAAM
jgi:hypothetical protein